MSKMKPRVAIVGIYHESNTFHPHKTHFEDFEKGHLLFGDSIRSEYQNAYHEIGGMLEVLYAYDIEAVPVMFAEAMPGGAITSFTYDRLFHLLFEELNKVNKLDGILVAAHGAAVSESFADMDGHWLQKLRGFAGEDKPIIATLDPHANVSQQMVKATNALCAYKTNPHIDQRQTGKSAAALMVDTIRGKIKPVQHLIQSSVAISIEQQYTHASPCKELYELASQESKTACVLASSIILGFPYADVSDMGSSFIVVTDDDYLLAQHIANKLNKHLLTNKEKFVGDKIAIEEAIQKTKAADKPVLLLDMGDNVGGGSPGDSTFLTEALEKEDHLKFFMCLYDPEAVNFAREAGVDTTTIMTVGAKTDPLHGKPFTTSVRVDSLKKGVFRETQPRHGGQVTFNMGDIALVTTMKGNTLMLTSRRIAPFSLKQLTTFGIDPTNYDVLVAKGVHAPLAAYGEVCKTAIRVNTPGITQADMTALSFVNRRRPLHPFDKF